MKAMKAVSRQQQTVGQQLPTVVVVVVVAKKAAAGVMMRKMMAAEVMLMVSLLYRSNAPTDVLASSDIGAHLIKKNLLRKSGQ